MAFKKSIEPSEEFKKKMTMGGGKLKVKVKAKGKVSPSKLASMMSGMK